MLVILLSTAIATSTPVTGITCYQDSNHVTININKQITASSSTWLQIATGVPRSVNSSDAVFFTVVRTDTHKPITGRIVYDEIDLDVYESGTYTVRGSVTYFKQ